MVGGSATIQGQGTASVTVNQSSQQRRHQLETFNIGDGETTNFISRASNSIQLNRVIGGLGPSQILGTLTANGRVFIVNRDGILFGAGAIVNTAGFLATTQRHPQRRLHGRQIQFQHSGPARRLDRQSGHHHREQRRLRRAGGAGRAQLRHHLGEARHRRAGAGNAFTLDFYGDRLITLAVNDHDRHGGEGRGDRPDAQVAGQQRRQAQGQRRAGGADRGGRARTVVDSVINNTGVIEANSVGTRNGMIVLGARDRRRASRAGAPAQTSKSVAAQLSAAGKKAGTKGGTVVVTGENIVLTGAKIDASGPRRRRQGADRRRHRRRPSQPAARLEPERKARSLRDPDRHHGERGRRHDDQRLGDRPRQRRQGGGVVGSEDHLCRHHPGARRSQVGNGGFVETSGHRYLDYTGFVSTLAANGRNGTLLLDPEDVVINQTFVTPGFNVTQFTVAQLNTMLLNGNVVITTNNNPNPPGATTNGDIFVNSGVNLTWSNASSLTLNAVRNVTFGDNVLIKNTGSGDFNVRADSQGSGTGNIIFNQFTNGSRVDWTGSTGKVAFFYRNPAGGYTSPTDFTPAGQGGGTRGVTTNGAVPDSSPPTCW